MYALVGACMCVRTYIYIYIYIYIYTKTEVFTRSQECSIQINAERDTIVAMETFHHFYPFYTVIYIYI